MIEHWKHGLSSDTCFPTFPVLKPTHKPISTLKVSHCYQFNIYRWKTEQTLQCFLREVLKELPPISTERLAENDFVNDSCIMFDTGLRYGTTQPISGCTCYVPLIKQYVRKHEKRQERNTNWRNPRISKKPLANQILYPRCQYKGIKSCAESLKVNAG